MGKNNRWKQYLKYLNSHSDIDARINTSIIDE